MLSVLRAISGSCRCFTRASVSSGSTLERKKPSASERSFMTGVDGALARKRASC
jgi:hypothetical protein